MSTYKTGAYIPISLEILADTGRYPWLTPDRNPFPTFVLFPRIEQARLLLTRARWRLADTWDVLLHGLPDHDEQAA